MSVRALFRFEQASGALMIGAMLLALAAANSPLASLYQLVHHAPVHLRIGPLIVEGPLVRWINQGLMALFFVVVGLEIKRQLLEGHLSSAGRAALPALAALGGMAAPAAIYLLFTWREPELRGGWAIPTATDIVLALGVLALLGRRVPDGLRIFLTALAVFDDIGAVLVMALFYGHGIAPGPLLIAGLAVVGLAAVNRRRSTRPLPYVVLGTVLWAAMAEAGLEPALAGLIVGAAVPLRAPPDGCRSPLRAAERSLHPYTTLLIVPAFAFFNAGIDLRMMSLEAVPWCAVLGVGLGLFLGKQLGIMAMTWIAVRSGLAGLPRGVGWRQVYGTALLAGIGFTMSLFVASLAFADPGAAAAARLAILAGSMASAIAGVCVLAGARKSDDADQRRPATPSCGPVRDDIARRFDALAPSWDRKHGPVGVRRLALAARSAYLRRICDDLARPRVLDIGCGTGQQLLALADRVSEGVGIDVSPAMIARARLNARDRGVDDRLRFEVLAGEDAGPDRIGHFDLILCIGALEHMADPDAALAGMAQLLRNGGLVVLVTGNPWHPRSFYSRMARAFGTMPPARYWRRRTLRERAAAVGLHPCDPAGLADRRQRRLAERLTRRLPRWLAPLTGSHVTVFTTRPKACHGRHARQR